MGNKELIDGVFKDGISDPFSGFFMG